MSNFNSRVYMYEKFKILLLNKLTGKFFKIYIDILEIFLVNISGKIGNRKVNLV